MQYFNREGGTLHACSSGKGNLFGDESSVIAHPLCEVDHEAIFLCILLDLLSEGYNDL